MVAATLPDEIEINLATDTLLTLSEAMRTLPTKPSPATSWRWHAKGVNGVRLPVIRCGGRLMTSIEALREFLRRQNRSPDAPVDSDAGRNIDNARAMAVAAGIL